MRLGRRLRLALAFGFVAGAVVWAWWSYGHEGLVAALILAARDRSGSLDLLRDYLEKWGALAPVVYVVAVIVEVLVAPIPGAILYAPGGALFGGFFGGTLSLIGNVIGSGIAAMLARTFGERLSARLDASAIGPLAERLRARGMWLVALLRVNPLTSSDLVSYAAGFVRVPAWRVAAGTLVGLAPLCYAQSYLAERVFRLVPGSAILVLLLGLAYAAIVIGLIARRALK